MRAFVSILGIAAALVMGTVSAAMNFLFLSSLGKTPVEGQVLGAASAAADLLKALLPFFIVWSWQAGRYAAAIAGALSFAFFAGFALMSAIGFAADNRGFLVERNNEQASAYQRVQRDLKSLERQTNALSAHRPPSVVTEDIARYHQNRRWLATKDCTDVTEAQSRDYCAGYFALRTELAAAQEAERLSARIAALRAEEHKFRESGAGQDRDPQVALLSRIFGIDQVPVRIALIIAVALLVEIGASLGLFLATAHAANSLPPSDEDKPAKVAASVPGSIEDFCLEALMPSETTEITSGALYGSYRAWCDRRGFEGCDAATFDAEFAALARQVGIRRSDDRFCDIEITTAQTKAA